MALEIETILRDPEISDSVKAALVPELSKIATHEKASQIPAWQTFLQRGPVIAALASVLTLAITEFVRVRLAAKDKQHQQQLANQDKLHEQSLERQKFEFEIIRLALSEEKKPKVRANNLRFLTDIGLLKMLDTEKLSEWSQLDNLPAFTPPVSDPLALKRNLYRETITIISQLIHQSNPISKEQDTSKRFWELYGEDLIGVESREVADAMIKLGNELEKLEGKDPSEKLKELGGAVINQIRGELAKVDGVE